MSPGRGGRPRDATADVAILGAATELVIERGFARLAVAEVAARAGVGKATIYRRWPSRVDLLRAVLALLPEPALDADTGDLRADLRTLLRGTVEHFSESTPARLMPQLCAEAQFDPEVREVLHTNSRERRTPLRAVLERAQRTGDLRDDVDLEVVVDMLTAPIFVRALVTGSRPTMRDADRTVEVVLAGIARTE